MGFFSKLKEKLTKTRGNLNDKVDDLVVNTRKIDDDFYDELTDILILSDIGMSVTEDIIEKLKKSVKSERVKNAEQAKEMLKELLIDEMTI